MIRCLSLCSGLEALLQADLLCSFTRSPCTLCHITGTRCSCRMGLSTLASSTCPGFLHSTHSTFAFHTPSAISHAAAAVCNQLSPTCGGAHAIVNTCQCALCLQVLSWIDVCAGMSAKTLAKAPCVTASVDAVHFLRCGARNNSSVLLLCNSPFAYGAIPAAHTLLLCLAFKPLVCMDLHFVPRGVHAHGRAGDLTSPLRYYALELPVPDQRSPLPLIWSQHSSKMPVPGSALFGVSAAFWSWNCMTRLHGLLQDIWSSALC